MQQRVVDGLAERAGRDEAAAVAETRAMQRGADDELAHVASRREPLEAVDGGPCIRGGVGDGDAASRSHASAAARSPAASCTRPRARAAMASQHGSPMRQPSANA